MDKLIKILAGCVSLMGCIHIYATFTPLINDGLDALSPAKQNAVTYMSLMCGTLLVLCGVSVIVLSSRIKREYIQRMVSATALVGGILAVDYMPQNPFAWMIMAISTTLAITLFASKIKQ